MYTFFRKNPALGIEITSAAVRVASFSRNGRKGGFLSARSAALEPGVVSEAYGTANILDREALLPLLRACLDTPGGQRRRAGLSLPDGIFRVQTVEFDALPGKDADRERLIRWRLEKTSAFDLSDTLLRYQVLRRQDAGYTVLSCIAKKAVIAQYESVLLELGTEAWSIGLSSFFTLNFYTPYFSKNPQTFALVHLNGDSFSTIISENGGARFYRFKDVRRGGGDITSRLVREIGDSLHFYMHMDRSQRIEVKRLYLSGEPATCEATARELNASTTLAVEVLSPELVLQSQERPAPEMSAALGAGRAA